MPFHFARRRLPHFRDDGATYFVTWRLAPNQRPLESDERSVVLDAVKHFHPVRYELTACVVMNDHGHALLRPLDGFELGRILHSWKSFTSKAILRTRGKRPPLWQAESYDRIVRDQAELDEKFNYILDNPFRRWPELQEYAWVWCEGMDEST